MRRSALAVAAALLCFVPCAFAGVTFEPALPTADDRVTVTITGGSSDGCIPARPQTAVTGQQITITLTSDSGGGCTLAPTAFRETVRLDELEPGVYNVIVRIVDDGQTTTETRQLVIGEADPSFVVTPAVVPESGGEVHLISTSFEHPLTTCVNNSCEALPVYFGLTRVAATVVDNMHLRVAAPPRGSGVVDVTIGDGPARRVSRAALRYAGENEEPNAQSFATVLVPLAVNGPGAFGSEWRTEIHMRNVDRFATVRPARMVAEFCPEMPPLVDPPLPCGADVPPASTVRVNVQNRPRGLLLHLPRTLAESVAFSAIVRDVSRSDISFGAELPIVREPDFRTRSIDFVNVPLDDPRYRIKLRAYVLDADFAVIGYTIRRSGGVVASRTLTARRHDVHEPAFATTDIGAVPPGLDAPTHLQVRVNAPHRFWAFLSVTNNETQQVTIIRPQ